MLAILSILATALYAVMALGLSYYRNSMARVTAETNARMAMSTITAEFRQASHWGSEATAILTPAPTNGLDAPAHELDFQELVSNVNLTLLSAGALDRDPSQFQLVRYYLASTPPIGLLRTVAGYDANGNLLAAGPPNVVVQSVNGSIDLSTVYSTSNSVTLVITAQEGGYTDAQGTYHAAVQDTLSCSEVSAAYH